MSKTERYIFEGKCEVTKRFAPAYCKQCEKKGSSECPAKQHEEPSQEAEIIDDAFYIQQIDKLDGANSVLQWADKNLSEAEKNLSEVDYEKLKSYVSQMVDAWNREKLS